ncbi:MAG: penicillin-binding protein 2 [Pseudomonadales bacterium]|nr:penicillin-binding protein 2 [Pseudomonadales bacterium]
MSEPMHLKDSDSERRSFSGRTIAVLFLVFVCLTILVVRLVQLQVVEHEDYVTRSDDNRIQVQALAPPRGRILDRHGVVLAENRAVFTLALVTERIPDLPALFKELETLVSLTQAEIEDFKKRRARRKRPFEAVALRLALSEAHISILSVNRHRLDGVEVQAQLLRYYPHGDLFAHAVGSVRRVTEEDLRVLDSVNYSATQFVGKRGIEQFYETSLHGVVGYQNVEIDARGRVHKVLEISPPLTGESVTVHLDTRLQIAVAKALGDQRGAVVAIEPKTGGILAMVSTPSYDPNLFITGMTAGQYKELMTSRDLPLFNRAVDGQYAPGSTFKPVVGLAGLAAGTLSWEDTINDYGSFRIEGQPRIWRDWSWKKNNSGGQGVVSLRQAIYRSSNVFFYDLAHRMGIDALGNMARQFGYGQATAIDVLQRKKGLMPDPLWKHGAKGERWYPGDTVNVGIGQGDVLATPLQVASTAMVIANRGHWMRPRNLLSSGVDLVEVDAGVPMQDIQGVNAEDWERIVDSMEDVVHRGNKGFRQNGTAWAYIGRDIGYRMAGKSGTAQVVGIQQGEEYDESILDEYQRKHAWFLAFAPADNPQLALVVLIENGGGGSSVAAPVAREIMDAYLLPELAGANL